MNDLNVVKMCLASVSQGLMTWQQFRDQVGMTVEQAYDWVYGR